uniref:Transposase n=1 Tax=Heterorhabditis bacteriophora TaxID=37862 RepID=A0A1I7X7Q9_HETBA
MLVYIDSEPLAMAIAEEWSSQVDYLNIGHMRLTGLAFTAQDNPLHMTRSQSYSEISRTILETYHLSC